jgi:N-acetylglucosaminyldiphosphoundecaprenol N-acetyl-beta-D-mannosaminyltransferase
MTKIFKINIEFNKAVIRKKIQNSISNNTKGYICVVDANVLAKTHSNPVYKEQVNSSMLNICDGSSIAISYNFFYGTKFTSFNGPTIFSEYVKKNYKQLILGNTEECHIQLKQKFIDENIDGNNFNYKRLPFLKVDEFNYQEIANYINKNEFDIIWVSLGAPKQEVFITKLFPFLNKGVCIAIGGAINLYIDNYDNKIIYKYAWRFNFIWVLRLLKQPRKQGKRIFELSKLWPTLLLEEYQRSKIK